MAPSTNSEALTRARAVLHAFQRLPNYVGWGLDIAKLLSVSSATVSPGPPTMTFTLPITHSLCQSLGQLHGGATATIFDICMSIALCLIQGPGFWENNWGVSRTLNVTYLGAVKQGCTVQVECEIVGYGRRMAHLRAVMRAVEEEKEGQGKAEGHEGGGKLGKILAACEHGKVAMDPKSVEVSDKVYREKTKGMKSKL
ncbi:uncharacterized protein KY384_003335 [Bacidia gigantensis]|uniref:uncharacterized protein n=1 Tax=Bacidia gigantensis TaxID=2732470 RepID=UPI001D0528A7|nr:uncharacterized protein KY384_003335 [Bacidia gigantensis]KAG8531703.1 hypothetical protein KY384_003335 [Bacidia gigantensis]